MPNRDNYLRVIRAQQSSDSYVSYAASVLYCKSAIEETQSHANLLRSKRSRTSLTKNRAARRSFRIQDACPFCSRPIFCASWMWKLLLLALFFVWLVRERLLRRQHANFRKFAWPEQFYTLNSPNWQETISEFFCASISNRVQMRILSHEN